MDTKFPTVSRTLAVYIILACEAIGDITATCDGKPTVSKQKYSWIDSGLVSKLDVEGGLFDSRIQGGLLADGLNGVLAGLATITPMSTYAQNNGVLSFPPTISLANKILGDVTILIGIIPQVSL